MTLQDLRKLVAQGESASLEFKRKVAHPDKIAREMVAFANTNGGQVIIGVSDNGNIPGLKYPEDEIFSMNTTLEKLCKPKLPFDLEEVKLSEKASAIIYTIPKSDKRPHYVKEDPDSKWGQAYVRYDDKSVKASREIREIIKRQKRMKDIRFNFGEKEKVLMEYLNEHHEISLSKFKSIAGINNYVASKTLILLVLANVLRVQPTEKGDIYRLKN